MMDFHVLGPLEVSDAGESVALGGVKQRATLGYLLLNANRVVATSQLLSALWPTHEAPVTARKVLHNAVWGLRRMLPGDGMGSAPALLTQPPGYKLTVDPESVDLYRFHRLVASARTELSAGSPESAAVILRQAMGLWRGPELADLAEAGIAWPELTAVRNARLDALEDYFDAELACGRHQAVLGELEAMADGACLRERSCGQLMLALYRCGRQADALAVYSRMRATLVERLGLEPGRDLQALQRSILAHSPSLDLVPPVTRIELPAAEPTGLVVLTRSEPEPEPPLPQPIRPARTQVSVVLVQTKLGPSPVDVDPADVDEALDAIAERIRRTVGGFGGVVTASTGLITMVLFEAPPPGGRDTCQAVAAVLATLAVRDGLRELVPPAAVGLPTFHAAVATGAVPSLAGSAVSGTLVDRCHTLLATADAGEIRLCPDTRRIGERVVTGWLAGQGVSTRCDEPPVDRHLDLELVRCLLERSRKRSTPHLVTVLGAPGTGKSAFLAELARLTGEAPPVTNAAQCSAADLREVLAATRAAGSPQPLVLLVDDLHRADDAVLDLVDEQTDRSAAGGGAVFVVATARPELVLRKPSWGAGKRDVTTITLDSVPTPAIEALWDLLLSQGADPRCEPELARRPA
ncbi:BTAD domain-containing putative transcriptional regulator [Actinosynnema sp. NPDC020468]|uniref:BTAD domain-containing putative transcriptional regulator n=1 Tax=Actinosynnema sp. NPDC020468 TaxID=3154488 RepID=UPI0033E656F3